MADRITIEFNHTMGQVTLYINNRSNLIVTDMNYKSELGEIVQEYYDEYRKKGCIE